MAEEFFNQKSKSELDQVEKIFKDYPDWRPNVLILGAGGVKGFQIIGALLRGYNFILDLDTIIGCSVGSIIGMMLCLNYTPLEIIKEAKDFNFFEFFDIKTMDNIIDTKGLIDPEIIKDKLQQVVIKKMGHSGTLKELYDMCGIEFISVISNKSKFIPEYISYVKYPDIKIVDIVFLSMNLPIIFHESTFNGNIYIDGAFTDPLPIHLKDKDENKILIICINEDYRITNENNNLITYIYDVITLPIIMLKKRSIEMMSDRCKILNMGCEVLDIGFITSQKDKLNMVKRGYEYMDKFINEIIEEENRIR